MPWLGCSATLDPVMLAEVQDLSGFDPSVHVQYTSIDRPDITFTIQPIQHSINGYCNLEFLIEPVKAAVEQVVMERRENMVREVLRHSDKIAAQTLLTSTRHQQKEAGSDSQTCCKTIPKMIVHLDSIKQIHRVVRVLTTMLIQAGCSKVAAIDAVQAYHSELAESDKRHISIEFGRPDTENMLDSSMHHIIIATDAMGMGINNPDI